jgi:hypothetical protein
MRVTTEHQLAFCVHFITNNHKKTHGSVMLEKEDGLAGGCFAKKSQSSSLICLPVFPTPLYNGTQPTNRHA